MAVDYMLNGSKWAGTAGRDSILPGGLPGRFGFIVGIMPRSRKIRLYQPAPVWAFLVGVVYAVPPRRVCNRPMLRCAEQIVVGVCFEITDYNGRGLGLRVSAVLF